MRSFHLAEQSNRETPGASDRFRYKGSSMHPIFKPGQVLYVRPTIHGIKAGDVVVYRSGDDYIVHRVKAVSADTVHTRGDNNPFGDDVPIKNEEIVGIVEQVEDWGKISTVSGGWRGLWSVRLRWGLNAFYQKLLPWLGAPYRWLKATGWVKRMWHPVITRVQLHTRDGILVKYVSRSKTVAVWQPDLKRFTCSRPYDLVLDPPPSEMQSP